MKSSRYSVRKHVVIRRHSVLNVAFNWIAIGNIGLRRTPFKVLINHMCRYTYHSIRTFRLCVNHLVHSINSATFNVHVCWIVLIYFNFLWHLMQSIFSFRTFFHRDFHVDDSWMEIMESQSELCNISLIRAKWNLCLPQSNCRARRASRWAIYLGRPYNVSFCCSWCRVLERECKKNLA